MPKKNKKNVFNGRILEMEGLPDLTVEQAFELTDAAAERSAAAAAVDLSEKSVATYLRSNVALMRKMIADGYGDRAAFENRIAAVEAWLAKPALLRADKNAEYAAVIEIDLAEITEPILACPNDPDDVKVLTDVPEHQDRRRVPRLLHDQHRPLPRGRRDLEGAEVQPGRSAPGSARPPGWTSSSSATRPTSRSTARSAPASRSPAARSAWATRPACRTAVTVFSTSTRNFDDRMGNGAKVFLGSAELGALSANLGRLPTPAEYFAAYAEKIAPKADKVYRYLQFDELPEYQGLRVVA